MAKLCLEVDCGEQALDGKPRCADHQRATWRSQGRARIRNPVHGSYRQRQQSLRARRRSDVCTYCGGGATEDDPLTLDHVIPLAAGGDPWDPSNLELAHRSCNAAKRDRPLNAAQLRRIGHEGDGRDTTATEAGRKPRTDLYSRSASQLRGRMNRRGPGTEDAVSGGSTDRVGGLTASYGGVVR
jgi:5-methylcytosine-specific restriction endonuclease McrA